MEELLQSNPPGMLTQNPTEILATSINTFEIQIRIGKI